MVKFCHLVQGADVARGFIPIGKPIDGARAVLLDEAGKACPRGTVGEIIIRTPYRSLGYYRQPELTREVFVQNPFSDDPDDLVYRTGDLGRMLHDGSFQFVARKDDQVKYRGVRIELGEVEAALLQHSDVQQAAVMARHDGRGDQGLVAYFVAIDEKSPTTSDLRRFLQRKLPDHMIPSAFVALDALPLSANGKVNRKALPSPDGTRPLLDRPYVAPRNPTEQAVASVWSEALAMDRVGVHDDFFELGGHSLTATQVISRMREQFRVEIPLKSLFEKPTVAHLAALIDRGEELGPVWSAPPIELVVRDGDLPLSFAQERLWFVCQLVPEHPFYNMPYCLELSGALESRP